MASATCPVHMPYGPLMIDLQGPELLEEEREKLLHPAIGGVILFQRNCQDAEQTRMLCHAIHELRDPPLIIGIDQEGGRVQRLRKGVTHFPPQAVLGELADAEGLEVAIDAATGWGQLLGYELGHLGIDLDFTPCVDVDHGVSSVIGDRALHHNAHWVAALGTAIWQGMSEQGLAAAGKHFPGHGGVAADSHLALPRDSRSLADLEQDLIPFHRLVQARIPAIMPAHCLYTSVDPRHPAGYSSIWLQDFLRIRLGFSGVIISDDLSMAGALGAGAIPDRLEMALSAGCDLLLLCNDPAGAETAMQYLQGRTPPRNLGNLRGSRQPRRTMPPEEAELRRHQIDGLAHRFPHP